MWKRRSLVSITLLLALTAVIYMPSAILLRDEALNGRDYFELHIRRIAFAQKALIGPGHFLPAWYPGELFGTPFSANLQSFPWIPTRLLLLLLPAVRFQYAVGVLLSAVLAAAFTYLYCRRAGLSEVASVASGWTFASAGFFSSRVFAGHLPLLEAYPSLPLLLWLADRAVSPDRPQCRARDLAALALAAACVAVAGHPQLPAYSLAATGLFLLFRPDARNRKRAIAAMALGVGATLAAWWPMLLLVGRSTRALHLDPSANDVTLPYHRLLALIRPGLDGWPTVLDLDGKLPFHGYPNNAWFWDTASYVGLLPLIFIAWLLMQIIVRKRPPAWPWRFFAVLGAAALLFALPAGDFLRRLVPIVLFRSPARLLYLSTFSASLALGVGVDSLLTARFLPLTARRAVIAACLLFHAVDLGGFARVFVQTVPWEDVIEAPPFATTLLHEIGTGRIAARRFPLWCWQQCDEASGFDSIMLAGPYRAMLALTHANPKLNQERVDASVLSVPALQTVGVRFVLTDEPRRDLRLIAVDEDENLYGVPDPAPRASFFGSGAGAVLYSRPSSDRIQLESTADQAGFIHVLESWDPGWTAQVDGAIAPLFPADGFAMAVPVPPGKHLVSLSYRTPGRTLGWVLSLISVAFLGALIATTVDSTR